MFFPSDFVFACVFLRMLMTKEEIEEEEEEEVKHHSAMVFLIRQRLIGINK